MLTQEEIDKLKPIENNGFKTKCEESLKKDIDEMVQSPKHYDDGEYECIKVIHAIGKKKVNLLKEAYGDWQTAFKYLWRVGNKKSDSLDTNSDVEKSIQDIKKAIHYQIWMIQSLRGEKIESKGELFDKIDSL